LELPKEDLKEKEKLVAGPRWVPDTKTDWPIDCLSLFNFNFSWCPPGSARPSVRDGLVVLTDAEDSLWCFIFSSASVRDLSRRGSALRFLENTSNNTNKVYKANTTHTTNES
jgi:hypothetical protein